MPDRATTVLYVDDEPPLCRAFARTFRSHPEFDVHTAASPTEALERLTKVEFDIVVSDLRMPEMDGIAFLRRVREARPEARRLLITGFADFQTAVQAINEIGIDSLLAKPWDPEQLVSSVSTAAELCALRRENERMTVELMRRATELRKMNHHLDQLVAERTRDLLNGLVSALDLRDSETQWHSLRVGQYARRLAEELRVPADQMDDIERGAILHDIGKIGVRDSVLLKPGPLDDKEWAEMRRHPSLGYDILKGIKFLDVARLIPLHHQERWDGKGYPAGLKGEEICLGARIFAVVDTYDAITSNRPYRRARSYAVARAEIERCSDSQFDPRVVNAWLGIDPDEWHAIRSAFEAQGATD